MRRLVLLALAGTVFAGNVSAATITGNSFVVTAKVDPSCVVTGDTDIDFGTYDPAVANFGTADTATGSISVRCTKGTNISIGIEQGTNPVTAGTPCSTTPQRRMRDGATSNYIAYNILQTAGGSAWGCGFGTSAEVTRAAGASNTIETFTTYGVIPQAQDVPAGTYTDTVNYVVTF